LLVLKRKRMLFREEARRGMMQSEEQEEKPATNGHIICSDVVQTSNKWACSVFTVATTVFSCEN